MSRDRKGSGRHGVREPFDYEAPAVRRRQRDGEIIRAAFRNRDDGRGFVGCDVCGWRLPPALRGRSWRFGLEGHHVIPLSRGGADVVSNIAVVCPTHHRVAHRVAASLRGSALRRQAGADPLVWLVAVLRNLDDEAASARTVEDAREAGSVWAPPSATLAPEERERRRYRAWLRWRLGIARAARKEGRRLGGPVRTLKDLPPEDAARIRQQLEARGFPRNHRY